MRCFFEESWEALKRLPRPLFDLTHLGDSGTRSSTVQEPRAARGRLEDQGKIEEVGIWFRSFSASWASNSSCSDEAASPLGLYRHLYPLKLSHLNPFSLVCFPRDMFQITAVTFCSNFIFIIRLTFHLSSLFEKDSISPWVLIKDVRGSSQNVV